MSKVFHITSGDIAGGSLAKAGLPGEVFDWHDILYMVPGSQVGRVKILSAFVRCFWRSSPQAVWIWIAF